MHKSISFGGVLAGAMGFSGSFLATATHYLSENLVALTQVLMHLA